MSRCVALKHAVERTARNFARTPVDKPLSADLTVAVLFSLSLKYTLLLLPWVLNMTSTAFRQFAAVEACS